MATKDKANRKMVSFKLPPEVIQMVGEIADLLTEKGPLRHTKTDALEIAVRELHRRTVRSKGE